MDKIAVESSNLAAVGWDNNILEVDFKNGRGYRYFKVPREKFDALLAADSVGRYLNAEIKPHHGFEEINPDDAARRVQLAPDGTVIEPSQALEEVLRELHFLRYAYLALDPIDNELAQAYADRYGWPAPPKYQPETDT